MQLCLFEPNDEISILKREIENIKKRSDNVRRGLFSRHQKLATLYMEQQKELEVLKKYIFSNNESMYPLSS